MNYGNQKLADFIHAASRSYYLNPNKGGTSVRPGVVGPVGLVASRYFQNPFHNPYLFHLQGNGRAALILHRPPIPTVAIAEAFFRDTKPDIGLQTFVVISLRGRLDAQHISLADDALRLPILGISQLTAFAARVSADLIAGNDSLKDFFDRIHSYEL